MIDIRIQDHSNIIHSLWIGDSFSSLELLTLESFIQTGHTFLLWAYGSIATPLPKLVILQDANQIIPFEKVFQYKNKNQFGHGKGSYAGFSDIFRYRVLYEYGGWWVDMDVTCLKPLDFTTPYVFRTHHDLMVVGNIMKCPPKSELMLRCYQKAVAEVNADNRDWNKPIRILNETIEELGLEQYIVEMSNRDSWNVVRKMIAGNRKIPDHWYVIHWVNEEWRRNEINKDYAGNNSVLNHLYTKYKIIPKQLSFQVRMKSRIKLLLPASTLRYLLSWVWGYLDYYLKRVRKTT